MMDEAKLDQDKDQMEGENDDDDDYYDDEDTLQTTPVKNKM